MSILEKYTIQASTSLETKNIAFSVARSLYASTKVIHLRGDVGAGKTTFVQGFAQGLGLYDPVTSPTYALEERYGAVLSHIDLYRLNEKEARHFMETLDEFPGVRIIEWPEKALLSEASMVIALSDNDGGRSIEIECHDINIPTDAEIQKWIEEVCLPSHIEKHMEAVAVAAEKVADALLLQKRFVRRKALRGSALTHDLLRFVDFRSLSGDAHYTPTQSETGRWTELRKRYGQPHEKAAEIFLSERGFPDLGSIVAAHRGMASSGEKLTTTIEQEALAYADKRVAFDKPVTLEERFKDFTVRYGNGTESIEAKRWKQEMQRIEASLFPDGVAF